MDPEQAFDELKSQTDAWVDSLTPRDYLDHLRLPKLTDVKIIRDAVSGYQILEPYEYLVLDHPLIQRLRYIHQTALAYLVYPSANHTRFDHSLGCAKIAQSIGERLLLPNEPTRLKELKLTALLHDMGHTFLSHLSETIIEANFKEIYSLLGKSIEFKGLRLKMSEMLSYLIFTNDTFQKFLDKVVHPYYPTLDLETVGKLLKHKPNDKLAYMGDIISGSFDVDKLDYLVRDCFFTGIRADVDVERVVVSTGLLDSIRFPESDPRWKRRSLVMQSGGVSILEQITFNKMLLFPAIYHHHKVRAIESMVKAIFEIIFATDRSKKHIKFNNILDFYKMTDAAFLTMMEAESEVGTIVKRLLNRELLERCLVLSPRYAKDPTGWKELAKRHYEDSPEEIKWLRQGIYDVLPNAIQKRIKIHDLWVDIPKPPPLGGPDTPIIDIGTDKLLPLSEFFPYPHWISSYETNKLKGYIFCVCDIDIRKAVNAASQKYFKQQFGLEFDPRATIECKLN